MAVNERIAIIDNVHGLDVPEPTSRGKSTNQHLSEQQFAEPVAEPKETKLTGITWSRSHVKQAKDDDLSAFVFGVDGESISATVSGYVSHETGENFFAFARAIGKGKSPKQAFDQAFGD